MNWKSIREVLAVIAAAILAILNGINGKADKKESP